MGGTRFWTVKLPQAIFWLSYVFYASIANAITLAPIAVQSYLGQNLTVEIDILNATPQEELSLKAGIAAPKSFMDLSMDYNQSIGDAQVELLRRPNGMRYIKLRSTRPISEPFVDLVIEVSSSAAKLIRPYRLLLDPPPSNDGIVATPELAERSAIATSTPVGAASVAAPTPLAAIDTSNVAGENAKIPTQESAPRWANEQKKVRVLPGETAGKIAARLKPDGASTEQMLIALMQSNPQAFIQGNVNAIRSGALISVPTEEKVYQINAQEARSSLSTQAQAFNTLRRASEKEIYPAKGTEYSTSNAVTANTAKEKIATETKADALKLSKNAQRDKKEVEKLEQLAQEKTRQRELERAAELAKNVQELSALAKASAVQAPGPASSKPLETATSVQTTALPSSPPASSPDNAASTVLAAPITPALQVSAPQSPPAPATAASTSAAVPVDGDVLGLILEGLADSWDILLIGTGLLCAGAGGLVWARKQQNKSLGMPPVAANDKSEAPWTINTDVTNAAYGGDQVDTSVSNSRIQAENTVFAAELDPVAEADVYLAYGKDEPAEEILREGLMQDPERVAIHIKLAEIYAARRDSANFAICADQVEALAGIAGTDWAQIQSLGQAMEPNNPRYQNSAASTPMVKPNGGVLEFENSVFQGNSESTNRPAKSASAAAGLDPVLSFVPGGDGVVPGAMDKSPSPKTFNLSALSLDLAANRSPHTQSFSEQLETSMELAKQFIEIGELQGARSMLDEVIANGSEEQRNRAQAMLAKLK
jgi:pilus assembly protein FimV